MHADPDPAPPPPAGPYSAHPPRLVWVAPPCPLNFLGWGSKGREAGLCFFTGYVIEYSLSVDIIFVFVLIFTYFRIPPRSQHRVLVWGILGALVMRGIMIWLGVALVSRFHFVLYLFGVFLLITSIRMFFGKTSEQDFGDSWWMRSIRKMIPGTRRFYEKHFKD